MHQYSDETSHRRDQPPPRSPETIPVNLSRAIKRNPSTGTKKPCIKNSNNNNYFDPALLSSNLQELDEAVARLAANSIQQDPHPQQLRRQRDTSTAGHSIHNHDSGSQFSEFGGTVHFFQCDTTNYVIDNMERLATGVAFPPLSRSNSRGSRGSRRSRSSHSSQYQHRKRGPSLERLISETILNEEGQRYALDETNDVDDGHSSCSNATSTIDILKDLRQMNQGIVAEKETSVGTASNSIGSANNLNLDRSLPPSALPISRTIVPEDKMPTTTAAEGRKPTSWNKYQGTCLLPHIETEDDEPSLLPPDDWIPNWSEAGQPEVTTTDAGHSSALPDPHSLNKSVCTDDTDPETLNNSINEKSLQSSVSLVGDEPNVADAAWPAEGNHGVVAIVDDDAWTSFESTHPFASDGIDNNPFQDQRAADMFVEPLLSLLDSPSSVGHSCDWDAPQQPLARLWLAAAKSDDIWGPWSGSQASF